MVHDASDDRNLFGEKLSTVVGFVAGEMGVVRVELSGDRIGGYSLVERCTASAISANGRAIVVGTDEDVRIDVGDTGEYRSLGFGSAVAVGINDDTVYAARTDGTVGRLDGVLSGRRETEWETLREVRGPRRIAGTHLAADSGVFRLAGTTESLGLSDVNDIGNVGTTTHQLLAGTGDGLYQHEGDAWTRIDNRPVRRIVGGERGSLILRESDELEEGEDGDWNGIETPDRCRAVDVTRAGCLYAVTETGELFVGVGADQTTDGYEGWRSQPIGVHGVVGLTLFQ